MVLRIGSFLRGVEASEAYCEVIANRMRADVLDYGGAV